MITSTQGKEKLSRSSLTFPPAARRMDTLNDLVAASDLISLHCALTNETIQIINADCLQHIKPGISSSSFFLLLIFFNKKILVYLLFSFTGDCVDLCRDISREYR